LAAWPAAAFDRGDGDGAVVLDVDLVPVSLVIAWITEPPLPITSRILSGWILMVIRRGANSDSSARGAVSALAISPRMCRRPALACASATFMISSVMPSILMSICSAVMPLAGAGHLEVHVAEVILVAEDVGQHDEVVAFLDQAHRDAGDRRLDRARRRPSAPARNRRPRPSRTSRSTR
jgi:hypothetical protein